MRVGARETAEIGAVAFTDAGHEKAHGLLRRCGLLRGHGSGEGGKRKRHESVADSKCVHSSDSPLVIVLRPGALARLLARIVTVLRKGRPGA
jgi:hypothetical protein